MKIISLTGNGNIYSSNVYLALGQMNAIDDVNTLIDVGRDPALLDQIDYIHTGVGKKRIDQVILTHNHYDHTDLLPEVCKRYRPRVLAYSPGKYVDQLLKDGDSIRVGDRKFEVVHIAGHSSDSIALVCSQDGVLFCGDAQVIVTNPLISYEPTFVDGLDRLSRKKIKIVYPGHGRPMRVDGVKSLDQLRKENVVERACL